MSPSRTRRINPVTDDEFLGAREAKAVLEHALFEVKRIVVGQDRMIERLFVCLLSRGHCLLEGAPGPGQDLGRRDHRHRQWRRLRSHPVHPRSRACRPRRHPHLPSEPRGLRRRAGTDLRQHRAGRRDQPGAGQGPICAARGDGRAPRVDRWRDLRRARPVPGAGHPEPDRERGRVPAARGAARPLLDEGPRRLPHGPRGGRDRPPHERRPPVARSGPVERAADRAPVGGRRRVRPRGRGRLRRPARLGHPSAGRARPRRPRAR